MWSTYLDLGSGNSKVDRHSTASSLSNGPGLSSSGEGSNDSKNKSALRKKWVEISTWQLVDLPSQKAMRRRDLCVVDTSNTMRIIGGRRELDWIIRSNCLFNGTDSFRCCWCRGKKGANTTWVLVMNLSSCNRQQGWDSPWRQLAVKLTYSTMESCKLESKSFVDNILHVLVNGSISRHSFLL